MEQGEEEGREMERGMMESRGSSDGTYDRGACSDGALGVVEHYMGGVVEHYMGVWSGGAVNQWRRNSRWSVETGRWIRT